MKKYSDAMNKDLMQERHSRTVNRVVEAYKAVVTVVQHLYKANTVARVEHIDEQGEKKSIHSILSSVALDAGSKEHLTVGTLALARSMFRSPLESQKELACTLLNFAAEKYSSKSKCSVIDRIIIDSRM